MNVVKTIQTDAQVILNIQRVAYLREAQNNDQIAPLTEILDQMKEDFQMKTIFKATLNDKIVGSVRGFEEKGIYYVKRLMVHPDYQNKGIGKKLMIDLEQYFPSCDRFDKYWVT